MRAIQIILILISVLVLFKVFLNVKKKRQTAIKGSLWGIIWVSVLVAAIFPQFTTYLASLLGVGRGADLILYSAVLFLSYLLYKQFIRIGKIDAGLGLVLLGDGKGNLTPLAPEGSGLGIKGDIKSIQNLKTKDSALLIFGINQQKPEAYQIK